MRLNQTERQKKLYIAWTNMKQRCNGGVNPLNVKYYRERGITYSPAWESFDVFCDEMSAGWKKGLTLDRIDNNGDYSKENCRWANKKTQAINRSNTQLIPFKGERKTLTDWSPIVGVARSTLAQRLYCYHWSIERALSTSVL